MNSLGIMLRKLCPDRIERKPLGQLGTFYSGLSGKSKADFIDGNAPFLAYKIVFSNLSIPCDIPDKVKVSEGEKQNAIHRGDIIFTGSSETQEEAGMTCVATREPEKTLYLNSFCFGFRPGEEFLLPDFSKFLFRTAKLRREFSQTASGVTRFNISKERLARISIPLPPLPVQKEIVRRLDAMQEVVEALETELALRHKQYETVRKCLIDGAAPGAACKALGECCKVVNAKIKLQRSEYQEQGQYPIIDQGQDYICGYTNREDAILDVGPVVLFGDHTRILKYADFPFAQGADGLKILQSNAAEVLPRYCFHALSCAEIPNRGYSRHWSIVKQIEIPLPPLSVQTEIAAKLDAFDELVNIALPAEIAARRRAFEAVREECFAALEAAG